jgi:hypothetical protein
MMSIARSSTELGISSSPSRYRFSTDALMSSRDASTSAPPISTAALDKISRAAFWIGTTFPLLPLIVRLRAWMVDFSRDLTHEEARAKLGTWCRCQRFAAKFEIRKVLDMDVCARNRK